VASDETKPRDKKLGPLITLLEPISAKGGLFGLFAYAKSIGPEETLAKIWRTVGRAWITISDYIFDKRLGIDTRGYIAVDDLDVSDETRQYSEVYAPTPAKIFNSILNGLELGFTAFDLVDIGCGKGRTLIVAKPYGFETYIGVEHSSYLARVAKANCERFLSNSQILNIDARDMEFSDRPQLIYMFSPFNGAVLSDFFDQVHQAYKRRHRAFIIIFTEDPDTRPIPLEILTASVEGMIYSHSVRRQFGAALEVAVVVSKEAQNMLRRSPQWLEPLRTDTVRVLE
jgi:hypothetical protein